MFCLGRICFVGCHSMCMRSLIVLALVCSWWHGTLAHARARSMVVTDRGFVSTKAGAQVLAKGGSAIDAAIAANAALGAAGPMTNGIGAVVSAPRFTIGDTGEPIGCKIVAASRAQPAVSDELRCGAHDFVVHQQYSAMMGWGQAVLPNAKTGGNFRASDPRAEGAAEPEPISLE
jgi:hypothetical protein